MSRPEPARNRPAVPAPREHAASNAALTGRIPAISLFDLCQFLMLNRKTGTLAVRSAHASAFLTFQEGQLANAVDDRMREGQTVLLEAVQWDEGSFEFNAGPVPSERRIQASTETLLLEVARQLDEKREAEDRDGGRGEGHREAAFRESQERAASLAEEFRKAVAAGNRGLAGAGDAGAILEALTSGRLERILLDPEGAGVLVGAEGAMAVEEAAVEELARLCGFHPSVRSGGGRDGPAAGPRDATTRASGVAKASAPHPAFQIVTAPGGARLWVRRFHGPRGAWAAVGCPSEPESDPARVGLTAEQAEALDPRDHGVILLSAGTDEAGSAAVAAWLCRRAARRPDLGWVIERWPRHDWARLPGRIESVHPESFRRPGDLTEHCEASGSRILALADEAPELWVEALRLAGGGREVLIRARASSPREWWDALGLDAKSGPTAVRLFWRIDSTGAAGAGTLASTLALPPWVATG